MELSSPPSLPTSPSSLLLKSRVRVFHSIPNLTRSPFQASIFLPNQRNLTPIHLPRNVSSAVVVGDNASAMTTLPIDSDPRVGEVKRVTKETNVSVKINLDGSGVADSNTGIPFLDHMLDQLASHGLFDVHVKATGDIHIDDHHTNEDVALAIGTALLQALGDRKGINRFGNFSAPLDEALIHVSLDLSGRPYLGYNLDIPTHRVGTYDTQLVEHFFQSLVNTSGMTLHIRQNEHVYAFLLPSLLEKIPIILSRQPLKLLLGLFDKQQSMIHVAVEPYQVRKEFCLVTDIVFCWWDLMFLLAQDWPL
ncbi:imidazoleglycerol-phosphate dehydratase, chloroplastic-like isoform X1 [Vigna umbellata]|uniref:imidazoleglycerol-phosphate dehydratase, chloroplastic-like isoform X1 n=1 Tax=Vigna umbellata TaxID=87088 RepID=UPI001F5F31E2|nr:imidazoleglycerol-phosphate dehydratase, chloroplastic-like isoform X1 [Vigna umbellata]